MQPKLWKTKNINKIKIVSKLCWSDVNGKGNKGYETKSPKCLDASSYILPPVLFPSLCFFLDVSTGFRKETSWHHVWGCAVREIALPLILDQMSRARSLEQLMRSLSLSLFFLCSCLNQVGATSASTAMQKVMSHCWSLIITTLTPKILLHNEVHTETSAQWAVCHSESSFTP